MIEWIRRGRRASSRRRLLIGLLAGLLFVWCLGGLAYWRCVVVGACELGGRTVPDLPAVPEHAPVAWLEDRMLVTGRQPMTFEIGRAPARAHHEPFFRELADWLTRRPDQLVLVTAVFADGESAETGLNRARWARRALIEAGVPEAAVIAWHQQGARPDLDFRVVRLAELPPVSDMDVTFGPGGALGWGPHAVRVLAAMRQAMAADTALRIRVDVAPGTGLDGRERALAAADQLVRLGFPARRVDIGPRAGQASGPDMTVRLIREDDEGGNDA